MAVAVLLLRGLVAAALALGDITEARYATIALHMYRSGDWITPWVYFDGRLLPFWGKPPLQFWLTAASFGVFGVSEWAARLPGLLTGAGTAAMVFAFARRFWGARVAAVATIVLATSLLFFGMLGTSTTDVTLACAMTATMVAFALTVDTAEPRARRWWGLALAVSLALGCLVKGPVAVVIPAASIVLWLLATREWRRLLRVPWVLVTGVALLLTVPWYLLAERATPGFLRYFLINEHILRYLKPEYGDLYGSGNVHPWGAVWAFLLAGLLPWSGLAIAGWILGRRRADPGQSTRTDPWLTYAVLWGLTPALFFTLARAVLPSYPLPGLSGLALAAGVGLVAWMDSPRRSGLRAALTAHAVVLGVVLGGVAVFGVARGAPSWVVVASGLVALVVVVVAIDRRRHDDPVGLIGLVGLATALFVSLAAAVYRPALEDEHSTKVIIRQVHATPQTAGRTPVFPFGTPYSASFYADAGGGPAVVQHPEKGLSFIEERMRSRANDVFIFKTGDWDALDPALRDRLAVVERTASWVACVAAAG